MRNLRTILAGGMLAIAILAWTGAFAVVLLDSGGASGAWYSPSRSGEGFFVEIVESGNQDRFVVTWYTYDGNRNQMWIGGNVLIPAGATSITVPVTVTSGPIFGDGFDASDVEYTPWGSLTFRFSNCDSGVVRYDSSIGFGSGTINLVRLTNLKQVTCR